MGSSQRRFGRVEATKSHVVPAKSLREQLVRPGDLRNEIGFQNDINILLAALDGGDRVWRSEAPMLSPDTHREEEAPPTLTELECIADNTITSELWAVSELVPAHQAA
jgi:hypothetical protein